MSIRFRKLSGCVLLLIGLCSYIVAIVSVADLLPDSAALKLLYFVVAGIVWAFPARQLVGWMQRPDPF